MHLQVNCIYKYPLNPVADIDPLGLVDINLYNSELPIDKSIYLSASQINIPDVFTVGAHGYPKVISDGNNGILRAKDLADKIRTNKKFTKGMTVWLFSCDTAVGGEGSFASQLAKELKANVIGADSLWTTWMAWDINEETGEKTPLLDTAYSVPTKSRATLDAAKRTIDERDLGNWVTFDSSGKAISSVRGTIEKVQDIGQQRENHDAHHVIHPDSGSLK